MLQARGFKVTAIKIDPYVNFDAGTMNPYMHGEVYVTKDGGETDLDLGGYERFLDLNLKKSNNITTRLSKKRGEAISSEDVSKLYHMSPMKSKNAYTPLQSNPMLMLF
jgi:hypothetical protein